MEERRPCYCIALPGENDWVFGLVCRWFVVVDGLASRRRVF